MGIQTPTSFRPEELKNYAINGNFDFWQRGTSLSLTATTGNGQYLADRITTFYAAASAPNVTISRVVDPAGNKSTYAWRALATSFPALTGSNYANLFEHRLEGLYYRDLDKKTITISFMFKASVVGTYPITVRKGDSTRSYVTTFAYTTPNVYQYVTSTIPMDTVGTYNTDNSLALIINIAAVGASTYQTAQANTWQSGTFLTTTTSTSWITTAGASIQIAQLMINLGSSAAPFTTYGMGYDEELAACRRYFEKSYDLETPVGTVTRRGVAVSGVYPYGRRDSTVFFSVGKRAIPSVTIWSPETANVPNTAWSSATGANSVTTNVINQNSYTPDLGLTGSVGAGGYGTSQLFFWQWTADAEI